MAETRATDADAAPALSRRQRAVVRAIVRAEVAESAAAADRFDDVRDEMAGVKREIEFLSSALHDTVTSGELDRRLIAALAPKAKSDAQIDFQNALDDYLIRAVDGDPALRGALDRRLLAALAAAPETPTQVAIQDTLGGLLFEALLAALTGAPETPTQGAVQDALGDRVAAAVDNDLVLREALDRYLAARGPARRRPRSRVPTLPRLPSARNASAGGDEGGSSEDEDTGRGPAPKRARHR